jgi:CBS domain-containing protein
MIAGGGVMLAKDIMRRKVKTLTPRTTIREAAKLFGDRHITGAPVVSEKGHLVGVVSQTDLVRRERERTPNQTARFHAEEEQLRASGCHLDDPDFARVEQIMTPWAVSFEEDVPVLELARQMLKKRIHRVVITRDGKLAGIVTTMDLLKALVALLSPRRSKEAL